MTLMARRLEPNFVFAGRYFNHRGRQLVRRLVVNEYAGPGGGTRHGNLRPIGFQNPFHGLGLPPAFNVRRQQQRLIAIQLEADLDRPRFHLQRFCRGATRQLPAVDADHRPGRRRLERHQTRKLSEFECMGLIAVVADIERFVQRVVAHCRCLKAVFTFAQQPDLAEREFHPA